MKLEYPKEWFHRSAEIEGESKVEIGNKMKYRIKSELHGAGYEKFTPQKKYPFWPFWFDMEDYLASTNLGLAQTNLMEYRKRLEQKPKYYEIPNP